MQQDRAQDSGKYSTDFEIADILFGPNFKGCEQQNRPTVFAHHEHYLTYLEVNPEDLVYLQDYSPSIRVRKLQENNPKNIQIRSQGKRSS